MTLAMDRPMWSQEIVWSPARQVGVREPYGTLVAELDNPDLVAYMSDLNAVAYRSGFWKISTYDRGDKEIIVSGREADQSKATARAAQALTGLLDRRT